MSSSTKLTGRLAPYLSGEKQPQVRNYFLGAARAWGTFFGAFAQDPKEMDELIPIINRDILNGFPDSFAFAGRDPIFSRQPGWQTGEH